MGMRWMPVAARDLERRPAAAARRPSRHATAGYGAASASSERGALGPADLASALRVPERADLERADLERADLERADLERADLERADDERRNAPALRALEPTADTLVLRALGRADLERRNVLARPARSRPAIAMRSAERTTSDRGSLERAYLARHASRWRFLSTSALTSRGMTRWRFVGSSVPTSRGLTR